jgi:hypothetical protein
MVMVAPHAPPLPASPIPASALRSYHGIVRFTASDMQVMLKQGIVPEDGTTELLHGLVVLKDRAETGGDPTMHGTAHRKCVVRLSKLSPRIDNAAQHVQTQMPLICGEIEAPEPDFAIIRGTEDDYDRQLPTGHDASCVIEVADSSLERDMEEKLEIYAAAGLPQYIVLNLRNRTALVFSGLDAVKKSYRPPEIIPESGSLPLLLVSGQTLAVPLADVLP